MSTREHLEMQAAFTALLASPVITRQVSPEVFALVRRHGRTLTEWFDTRLGYRLVLTATNARLFRLALGDDAESISRPARFEAPPRRALVLAILAAAAAEDADDVTSTQDLSDRVSALSARDEVPVTEYDADRFTERQLFVKALNLLIRSGALLPAERRSEDAREGWAHRRDAVGGAFEVQRDLLVRLVNPENLRAALRPDSAGERPEGDGPTDDPTARARFGVMRRLVELPVCAIEDLSDDERAYLARQRSRLAAWCHEMTGWSLEHRHEGIALIPDVEAGTDLPFPRQRAVDFATLMLLGHLLRTSGPGAVVGESDVLAAAEGVRAEHPRAMTAALASADAVADRARELLLGLDLLRPGVEPRTWRLMPAAARFRDPRVTQPRALAETLVP